MRPKVLIVDDNPMVRSSISRTLRAEELYVLQADSAEAAFEMFRNYEIALAIVDHLMPGLRGTRLLKWLKDRHPETVRIMLTAWDIESIRQDALDNADVHKFITKPWDPKELREIVRNALRLHEKSRESGEAKPGFAGVARKD